MSPLTLKADITMWRDALTLQTLTPETGQERKKPIGACLPARGCVSLISVTSSTANLRHVSGILRARPEGFYAEPKSPRLGGCAGSLRPTRLSLLNWEMQGDSVRKQREQRPIPAQSLLVSTRWTSLSLMQ